MKIKHWQGYGYLCAQKEQDIRVSTTYDGVIRKLTIRVWGNHECGLERSDDNYTIYNWLVKKFVRGYEASDVLYYRTDDKWIDGDGCVEVCVYTIYLRDKRGK